VPAESDRDLFDTIAKLTTEARNPRSTDLDRMDVPAILELINDEDVRVAEAVRGELPHVAAAVELVLEAFRRGGRLLYVGAGTSGRLGVLDAAECPPTFGSDPSLVRGIIAGGEGALVRAVEGAEDDAAAGARAIADAGVGAADVVCGIAASRRTPFVRSAVAAARAAGAKTVYITMNPRSSLDVKVDVAVCPVVGPEVLMGSTRMKAALAQKMVLTMITTAVFVRLGKTYENMMIDLMDTSAKLRERAKRVLMTVTGVEYEGAAAALQAAGGSVKTAIVMVETGVDRSEARRLLDASDGFVRRAIETHRKG
jgi:N-acetylmuramic acid 6-phosphate etherase